MCRVSLPLDDVGHDPGGGAMPDGYLGDAAAADLSRLDVDESLAGDPHELMDRAAHFTPRTPSVSASSGLTR